MTEDELLAFAEGVRKKCIEAALQGYEQASLSGLCHEGAWEAAIDSVRRLDLRGMITGRSTERPG